MRNVAIATRLLARLAGDDSRISFEGTPANTDLPKVSGVRQEDTETLRRLRPCDTTRSSVGQSGIAHCRAFQCPSHYRSRVVACYQTGVGFASTPTSGRPESVRCRESGAAVSRLYVFGSLPIT